MRDDNYKKSEDLIHSLQRVDSRFIEEADPLKMEKPETEDRKTPVTKITHKLPKIAVAAIAVVCVLALSGGVVWAMTASPLKDFFFRNSDKQYEEIFTEIGKKFEFKNIDVIVEESIYEESTGRGYTSFSVWDKEGNPVELQGKAEMFWGNFNGTFKDAFMDLRGSTIGGYRIGEDVFYILSINSDSGSGTFRGNTIFRQTIVRQNKEREPYKNEIEYIVLNEEQYTRLYYDLVALSADKEITYIDAANEDRKVPYYRYDTDQPDVIEVLDRYDPVKVKTIDIPAQVVTVDGLKITIGRTDIALVFNDKECEVSSFSMIREDGSRLDFKRRIEFPQWEVSGSEKGYSTSGAHEYDDGFIWFIYNYGFILGKDEIVKIEVNGETYE